MADVNNVFGAVMSLAESNTRWVEISQNLTNGLVDGIRDHLDNVENIIKNVKDGKIDCDISYLENIYSTRLDVFEAIVTLMTKINEAAKTDIQNQNELYGTENQKYKYIFEATKSQI